MKLFAVVYNFFELITIIEAAARLGISRFAAFKAYQRGRLVGEKKGRDILVTPESVETYATERKVGRPKKRE